MTSPVDEAILDDPDGLAAADTAGLLRACALAGAQVRSTAEAAREAGLAEAWRGLRPRALVLLDRPGFSAAVNRLLTALLGSSCRIPLVRAETVPGWVGPLDAVLAHSGDPGDTDLAGSIDLADRRGAHVLLAAPDEGPLGAAAAGAATVVAPRVEVPIDFGYPRALAAGLALCTVLELYPTGLSELADALDGEAHRCRMAVESFVNPAKSLALRLADHRPLLWGLDAAASAVGEHAAAVLAGRAAVISRSGPYTQALSEVALHRAAAHAATEPDIFTDPYEDAPGTAPLRVFLLGVASTEHSRALRERARTLLPGADEVSCADDTDPDVATSPVACAGVLALRWEMAACYLGLATGVARGDHWPATASSAQ
jgi:hypothetical protein